MRSSDWSSDVCSSDLRQRQAGDTAAVAVDPQQDGAEQDIDAGSRHRLFDPAHQRLFLVERDIGVAALADAEGIGCTQMREHVIDDTVDDAIGIRAVRSEEHTSALQSLMRISYDVVCLPKNNLTTTR